MNQQLHDEIIKAWEREEAPLVRGGQGRSDAEVEQSGLVVGVVFIGLIGFAAGLALGLLIGGGA